MKITKEKFILPPQFIDQLYELTGSGDSYKGFFLAIVDEDGDPTIYFQSDSRIVELGLRAAIKKFIELAEKEEDNNTEEIFDDSDDI